MKKILICILLFLCFKLSCQSLIGFYSGPNKSYFFDKSTGPHYSATYENFIKYCAGIYLKERKEKLINFTFELDYLLRSFNLDSYYGGHGGGIYREVEFDIQSINLRVLPEIKFGKNFSCFFNMGLYLGYIIYSDAEGTGSHSDINRNNYSWIESGKVKEEFNGFDLGLAAGLGFEIPISSEIKFLIDGNFSLGLNNISDGSLGSYAGFINSRNIYLRASLAYSLNNFSLTDNLKKL